MGNSVNAHIHQYLISYLKRENPQYAVMLNGAWGFGKTLFIRKWKESIKSKDIKPIYVSLFGLQTIKEVNELINKELHPILTSKATKTIIKTAKVLTGVAISHKLGNDESEMNYSIDLTSLLEIDNPKAVGGKIIIFDDMERCHIPPHLLLGYINYFVEICKCHVILICNYDKLYSWEENTVDQKYKEEFRIFKEKTIGIELSIQPSITEAIEGFITETKHDPLDFLNGAKNELVQFIESAKIQNMRSIRQAILDFTDIIRALDDNDRKSEAYNRVVKELLFNMVAFYHEARGNNIAFVNWDNSFHRYTKEDNSFRKALEKYNVNRDSGIKLFDQMTTEVVWPKFKTGLIQTRYLKQNLHKPIRTAWEILQQDLMDLSNEDFEEYYSKTLHAINSALIPDISDLIHAVYIIIYCDIKHIKELPEGFNNAIAHCVQKLFDNVITEHDFYKLAGTYNATMNYFVFEENKPEAWKIFIECVSNNYEHKKGQIRNDFTNLMENITDADTEKIKEMEFSTAPGISKCEYHRYPIFKSIDAAKVSESIMKLSNKSLATIWEWLLLRYEVSWSKGDVDNRSLSDDIEALHAIKTRLVTENIKTSSIQRFNLARIIKVMDYVCKAYQPTIE